MKKYKFKVNYRIFTSVDDEDKNPIEYAFSTIEDANAKFDELCQERADGNFISIIMYDRKYNMVKMLPFWSDVPLGADENPFSGICGED